MVEKEREKSPSPLGARIAISVAGFTCIVLQVALTRLISATASYHSSFVVISLVMLGLAASAFHLSKFGLKGRNTEQLSALSRYLFLGATFNIVGLLLYLSIYRSGLLASFPLGYAVCGAALFYSAFYYIGFVIAVILAKFPHDVSKLYLFDLGGAALACLLVIPLMDLIAVPQLIVFCSMLLALAALLVHISDDGLTKPTRNYFYAALFCACFVLPYFSPTILAPIEPKSAAKELLLYEGWNSLAKVSVYAVQPVLAPSIPTSARENPSQASESLSEEKKRWGAGWGLSRKYVGPVAPQYFLDLDSGASTNIVGMGNADKSELEFLKWDVTAAAYWLFEGKPVPQTFIIGGGGGRDITTASLFGANPIRVVELNPLIVSLVQERFGQFSGQPYSLPNVRFSIGEARSTISRERTKYDLIQMSMIDTFAASSSGSLVLSENALYTTEAITTFLESLTDRGILSISRWYGDDNAGELAKMISIIGAAFDKLKIPSPSDNVLIFHNHGYLQMGVATILVKTSPFTPDELSAARKLAEQKGFILMEDREPRSPLNDFPTKALLNNDTTEALFPDLDLRPSTDNWPFFFNLQRPLQSWYRAITDLDLSKVSVASSIMLLVLMLISLFTMRAMVRPILESNNPALKLESLGSKLVYFSGIGLGFMFIEIGLIQRYILFLGHPAYALTVVLFSLLVSAALGSYLSVFAKTAILPLYGVILGSLITGFLVPMLLHAAFDASLFQRILIAAACIAPLGVCMGMIFPLGVRQLKATQSVDTLPFLWGANGIASVYGSIISMMIATSAGYATVFVAAAISYIAVLFISLRWRAPIFSSETDTEYRRREHTITG